MQTSPRSQRGVGLADVGQALPGDVPGFESLPLG